MLRYTRDCLEVKAACMGVLISGELSILRLVE